MNTITIGGKAGHGVKAAAKLAAKIFSEMGYYIFILNDYPSVISGDHNYSKITFDKKEIYSYYNNSDFLIALDERTLNEHKSEIKKDGVVLFDKNLFESNKKNHFGIPAGTIVKESEGIDIMRNTALLGAFLHIAGIDFLVLEKILKKTYPSNSDKNIEIAKKGYLYAKDKFKQKLKTEKIGKPKKFLCGNMSLSDGALHAGLETYIAYPMTPATSILHYLAGKNNVKTIQPENEISVVTMALGSSYAGSKTMVGTSGGGFALMTESISFAGISEIPLVIVESQRAGPSTGVPTYTGQSDLNFTLNPGHGEFPLVVIAPGTPEQAFYNASEALQIAWKYQLPVIVLLDKHLSDSSKTFEIDKKRIKKMNPKLSKGGKNYLRYKFTKDGISPLTFPGKKDTIVKVTSYEHLENGITTENKHDIKKMFDKRLEKIKTFEKEMSNLETFKVYGKGNNVIVTWGSSLGAVLEAVKEIKDVKVIQPIYMKPFPHKGIKKHLKKAKSIVCVEGNATAQLADLIKLNTGIEIKNKVLKYDSREFEPIELRKELKRWFK